MMNNTTNNNSNISQLDKLKQLQSQSKTSNMTKFQNLVGIYLGTEPKLHYPKLFDEMGNKITEEKNGRQVDKRSEKADGWTYTFSEFKTCKKIQIVSDKKYSLEIMTAYSLDGFGYDIKTGNMFFLEKDTKIATY